MKTHLLAVALLALAACGGGGAELDLDHPPAAADAATPTLGVRLERTVATLPAKPKELAFSPDSRLLATSRVDGTVQLWRVSDGGLERTLTHDGGVTSVAFGPGGDLVATGGYDHTVKLWRVHDGVAV